MLSREQEKRGMMGQGRLSWSVEMGAVGREDSVIGDGDSLDDGWRD